MANIVVAGSGKVLATEVAWARRPRERAAGLLGHRRFESGRALILVGARQVHTFGMRFPIDALFVSNELEVVAVYRDLRPWRMTRFVRAARYVIELPAGGADGVEPGIALILPSVE